MKLSDEMRAWLGRQPGDTLLYDFILNFRATFGISALDASKLLAQWVKETC